MLTFRIFHAGNVVVLPGNHFLPCLQAITGAEFQNTDTFSMRSIAVEPYPQLRHKNKMAALLRGL